jgi:hypothetical protein
MTALPVSLIGVPTDVGIDHRVHRPVLVQLDGHHGIERQSGGVDSDPAAGFFTAHGLAGEHKEDDLEGVQTGLLVAAHGLAPRGRAARARMARVRYTIA